MEQQNSLEESKFESNWNIIDIKQITNKLSADKILKLINEELEIINHYEMNPTKIKEKADKLLLN